MPALSGSACRPYVCDAIRRADISAHQWANRTGADQRQVLTVHYTLSLSPLQLANDGVQLGPHVDG